MNDILNILKRIVNAVVAYALLFTFIIFLLVMMLIEKLGYLHIVHSWVTN